MSTPLGRTRSFAEIIGLSNWVTNLLTHPVPTIGAVKSKHTHTHIQRTHMARLCVIIYRGSAIYYSTHRAHYTHAHTNRVYLTQCRYAIHPPPIHVCVCHDDAALPGWPYVLCWRANVSRIFSYTRQSCSSVNNYELKILFFMISNFYYKSTIIALNLKTNYKHLPRIRVVQFWHNKEYSHLIWLQEQLFKKIPLLGIYGHLGNTAPPNTITACSTPIAASLTCVLRN